MERTNIPSEPQNNHDRLAHPSEPLQGSDISDKTEEHGSIKFNRHLLHKQNEHAEKIKARRRISATPVRDYMNPSKILIGSDNPYSSLTSDSSLTLDSVTTITDVNHNETSSESDKTGAMSPVTCRSISPLSSIGSPSGEVVSPHKVRFSFSVEGANMNSIAEEESVQDNVSSSESEDTVQPTRTHRDRATDEQPSKARRNGSTANPSELLKELDVGLESPSSHVVIHTHSGNAGSHAMSENSSLDSASPQKDTNSSLAIPQTHLNSSIISSSSSDFEDSNFKVISIRPRTFTDSSVGSDVSDNSPNHKSVLKLKGAKSKQSNA